MNIEEAIKSLKVLIGLEEFNKLSYKENKSIETLLTAYEKEKEKNRELEKQLQSTYQKQYINDLEAINHSNVSFK